MRQLPLLREEAVGPNLVGSSFPIICWFAPMHQTNVVASVFFSPQGEAQVTIVAKTQKQKQ